MLEKEDLILRTPLVRRVQIGRKQDGAEMLYRFLNVFGNDELGYIASYDEYFSPNLKGGNDPEFFEVRFQTPIFPTVGEALADAIPSAIKEAQDFQ